MTTQTSPPAHLQGTGAYLWKAAQALPFTTLIERLLAIRATHILVKIADGSAPYNAAYLPTLIPQLRAALPNLAIWGWQYLYSGCWLDRTSMTYFYSPTWSKPADEASLAAQLYRQYNLDGLALDVEGEFEHFNPASRASIYAATLRSALPEATFALSTFRYPSAHTDVPWSTFAPLCSLAMPQVYWMQDNRPEAGAVQLDRSYQEYTQLYQALKLPLEYVPTGAAFHEGGWSSTPAQVTNFLNRLSAYPAIRAANFWEYWFAAVEKPAFWDAIAAYQWSSSPADPSDVPPAPSQAARLTVNVGAGNHANLRLAPWGSIIATVPDGLTLYGSNPTTASDATVWWNVGCGFIAASVVTISPL